MGINRGNNQMSAAKRHSPKASRGFYRMHASVRLKLPPPRSVGRESLHVLAIVIAGLVPATYRNPGSLLQQSRASKIHKAISIVTPP
jgi:hypothetical protein